MQRSERALSQRGELRIVRYREFDVSSFESLLRAAFEIEQLGWKGQEQSSALSNQRAFQFYSENARHLAASGNFELVFLMLEKTPIAFEYGYVADRTYFSHKVSYDPKFKQYGPGHLLLNYLLQNFYQDGFIDRIDTMGILSPATARWCNDFYQRDRYIISTKSNISRALVQSQAAAKRAWQSVRVCNNTRADQQPITLRSLSKSSRVSNPVPSA
jgi:hypothetical protein